MTDQTPYSTAEPWLTGKPSWMDEEDGQRIAAYALYENMYWSSPDTFKLTQLGTDEDPIYIPNPRVIIEAILRYLCVDWDIFIDPSYGTEDEKKAAQLFISKFMKRENVKAKFMTQLRYNLIRGDAMWHIVADESKPAGSRVSLYELDPASYFPITDVDNLDRIIGCHLVDTLIEKGSDGRDTEYIRRQTYRREIDEDEVFTGRITTELALFEMSGWDDRSIEPQDMKLVRTLEEEHYLPEPISQLPVYHWKNIRNPADPFGSSQLRGLERLFAAVNQTISDEDLAVALAGLGVYATDANDPVDEDGNPTNWLIGPGRVVTTNTGAKFARVSGVTSVQPSQDHIKYIEGKIREGSGVPDIAVGEVDVQTAESGIALAIKMSPLLAANKEKQLEIIGKTDQMIYDLQHMWFPAYEEVNFEPLLMESVVGHPLPQNREAAIKEVIELATANPPLITIEEARAKLKELGYELSETDAAAILDQVSKIAGSADPFAARMNTDLAGGDDAGPAES